MAEDAKRIEPARLRELMNEGKAVVLDMRREYDRSGRQIPGAVRVDPDRYRENEGALPRGRTIVTYCT